MPAENNGIGRVNVVSAPVRQQVAKALRQAIFNLHLKPGQRLVERELCEQTGASRTSIREGLRELEAEGLVKNVPYKGLIVATVDYAQAANIYDVRCQLEGLLGRSSAEKRTASDIAALRRNFEKVRKTVAKRRYADLIKLKAEFYAILMAITDNPILSDILGNLQGRVAHFRAMVMTQPNRAEASIEEIAAIIDAIEAGNAETAEKACIAHVRNAGDLVLVLLADTGNT